MWAGTEPGAVFRSTDRGETFTLERALWDHPHRPQWNAGFGGQAFHTILPAPQRPRLGAGGPVHRRRLPHRRRGSQLVRLATRGSRPSSCPGTCTTPSSDSACTRSPGTPPRPDRLYLQNHGGVYRSDDGGDSWFSIADGLPSDFGFPVVVHPHEPDTVFVFPIAEAGARWPAGGRARVWRSRDAGGSWEPLGEGTLPDDYFVAVMRDAMCTDGHDPAGLYFGGRNGAVHASVDGGETWREIIRDLPDVMVVRAAAI